jgi:hypothetical protein
MAYVNSFQSRFWISEPDGCLIATHFNRNRPVPAPLRQFERLHLKSPETFTIEPNQQIEVDFNTAFESIGTFAFIKLSSCCKHRLLNITSDSVQAFQSLKVRVHNPLPTQITILRGSILCDLYIK